MMFQVADFIEYEWDIYIEGWFYQTGIRFLSDGGIVNHGAEGFHTWQIAENHLNIYDEMGEHSFSLIYIPDARLLKNDAKLRVHNNDVFLARHHTHDELAALSSEPLFAKIANRAAAYRSSKGEIWGYLFLGLDGNIYHYQHENERKWKIEENTLYIMKANLDVTGKSQHIVFHENEPECVKSVHVDFKNGSYQSLHCIDFLQPASRHQPAQFFHANVCLSNRSDILFISFNSAGAEYNGYNAKYEFHATPYLYGVDFIRIAQSPPTRWYLDNYQQIQLLTKLKPYRKVVLAGMSIGGFGALWFAEMLARNYPNIQYYSVVMQPQTSLTAAFLHDLRWSYSKVRDKRPKIPNDDLMANVLKINPNLELDVAAMLNEPVYNLIHHIFYDKGNDAEKHCSERMASERTILSGFDFNTTHAAGCGKLWDTGVIQATLARLLQAA